MKFPGTYYLEYQSIVDITINVLLGWDARKQKGTSGIVGELKAWAVAHEEQGRKTLHGHFRFWVNFLKELKMRLFSIDLAVREEDPLFLSSCGRYCGPPDDWYGRHLRGAPKMHT